MKQLGKLFGMSNIFSKWGKGVLINLNVWQNFGNYPLPTPQSRSGEDIQNTHITTGISLCVCGPSPIEQPSFRSAPQIIQPPNTSPLPYVGPPHAGLYFILHVSQPITYRVEEDEAKEYYQDQMERGNGVGAVTG